MPVGLAATAVQQVVKTIEAIPIGGADCALPMLWALEKKIQADAFVIYTDNETWHGKIHPAQALQVSSQNGDCGKAGCRRHDVKRLQHCGPKRRGHVGCRRFRLGDAAGAI